jgi:hypothetical protein
MPRRAWSAVLVGGLIAGFCDITYAIVSAYLRRGVAPARVLRYVASGLLGPAAFDGGAPAAALGLALHFLIALTAAAVFVWASRHFPALVRRPILAGALYGAWIFAFMNLVVVPLSRTPPRTAFPMVPMIAELLGHMFLIGMPIALAARWGQEARA